MSSRTDLEFTVEGTTIRGWFYTPDSGGAPYPTVVLQHGFSAVKEMHLDDYAEVFAAAGLACLCYDHPGFGASDPVPGTPKTGDRPVAADPLRVPCDHLRPEP